MMPDKVIAMKYTMNGVWLWRANYNEILREERQNKELEDL